MELKRMAHLVALADARHFGRAAERCHLSQPAFSRSVLAAEDELGLKLFNRETPEITCTDAGAFVVERARKLLFESRCLERDVTMYRERQIGDIAFGVGPYPAATLLLSLLCELRASYPGINTRVEVNNAQYLMGDWLQTTKDPYYDGYSVTFPRMGHTGNISNQDLLKEMAAHLIKYGPADAAKILSAK